jgi:hypothetical protein
MPDLAQRFTNLSVGCEPPTRLSGPVFANPMMPAMSHTYINQYTGSDYNLDKQMVNYNCTYFSRVMNLQFFSILTIALKKWRQMQSVNF